MTGEAIVLTPGALPGYLASRGLAAADEPCRVCELGGGVSNIVLLVEWPHAAERRWVVKQSLEKLRVKDEWRSERSRIFREAEAIRALRPVLGDSLPEVVYIDRENYLYVMTAAAPGSVVWKESLLAARHSDPSVAREAGALLARMISCARTHPALKEALKNRFEDRTVFDQLRLDPYYRTTASRHPDVAPALQELIHDSGRIRTSIVHGDYSPKNMLVRQGKIFLIDFEVVHWGDPAFDAGFLLNHLCLKAFYQPRFRQPYLENVRQFWNTLMAGLSPEEAEGLECMTLRHLGGLMLARIDGKSPVEYIRNEQTRDQVRRAAKRIIFERPRHLQDVIDIAGE